MTVLVLVCALAACTGDDDAVAPVDLPGFDDTTAVSTQPTQPVETAAPTTATSGDSTTTTVRPTTTLPPSTTAPESTSTTAPPTTESLDPTEDLAAAIQRDLTTGNDLLQQILADPSVPDAEERLEEYFTADALDFVLGLLSSYGDDDFVVLPNPDVPGVIQILEEPKVAVDSQPPVATVRACQIDSGILMAPLDDSDVRFPLNEDIVRLIAEITVEFDGAVWRLSDGGSGTSETGETTCE